jgi:MEMO1 family protein
MRLPAVAGLFYTDQPELLAAAVEHMLDQVTVPDDARPAPAYIVPHAGYRYSGPTAAHVYARLRRFPAERVVLVGPAHRFPLEGAAVPEDDEWLTPLGPVRIDRAGADRLVAAGLAVADDRPHAPEHALEVQVPFLQLVHREKMPLILPICLGQSSVAEAAAVIAAAAEGATVICSTDLSHYLTEPQAQQRDAQTVATLRELAAERLAPRDACGFYALRGLLAWARAAQFAVTVHNRCTSADTAGAPDRVVGYCAASLLDDAA